MSRNRFYFFIALALALFFPLFIFRRIGPFDFWWWLSANILLLTGLIFRIDTDYWRRIRVDLGKSLPRWIAWGFLSALLLYLAFWIGNFVSRELFTFAGPGINHVYDFRQNASSARIVILMLLIIGPGEELIWRGFIQHHFARRYPPLTAFLISTFLYTAIHLGSLNFMLILAALVCGAFWGILYGRFQSIVLNVVSHTVWDVLVFVIFPFSG